MKKLLLLTNVLLLLITSYSQNASIRGVITDTISKQNLSNTVITVLQAKDSILYKFTRSNSKGAFKIDHLKAGDYLLLTTYPEYADYVDHFTLSDTSSLDFGNVTMILRANLLQEVIVRQQIGAIKMKGDTTEFAADSFKVQPNATVEDLLKKLPGIQVDKNGQITAQGEKVQKVLVDGEEFFGDDPTLVTQNLRADMVDKVQVYDKKSDQATFTGVDDGQKQKTINLKLKDDKKNGYFGKVNLGGGTDGYHDSQAMLNMFKNKEKLAVYGIVSNTGKTGLNWSERNSYGESFASNFDYDDVNGFSYIGNSNNDDLDSWDGRLNGQGFPLVQTGGVHYNDKWEDDKESINGNYKILQLHINGSSATNSQYILPDTSYYNNQTQKFTNQILRNRVNGSYELQIDSSSSVKISADGGEDHKITNSDYYSEARNIDSALVNQSQRTISSTGDYRSVNSNLLWRKKLKKKGRTISVNLGENFINNTSDGYLYSNNTYYTGGGSSQQITDQYKTYHDKSTSFNSKITYSEPLSNVSSLVANYGISVNNSSSERNSYNKNTDGKYDDYDSIYSNDYRFNIFTQKGGLAYSIVKKKFRFNIGNNIGFTNFDQQDMRTDSSSKRNFVNWYPQASFSYNFSQSRRLSLQYNGNTQQPTIQQIQPVLSNDDPLNISIGNPALKPAFQNSFNINFSDYKVASDRYFSAYIRGTATQDAISSKDYVDSLGRRIYQSVNLNGTHSMRASLSYSFKIKKIDTYLGFNGDMNKNQNVSIENNVFNITNSGNYTGSIYMNKYKEKKFSFGLSASATYTNSVSSIQPDTKTQYWTFDVNPSFDVFLPLKFQIHSDCDFSIRQKTSVFDNNTNVILWNAWIGKKFMKSESLLIKVTANDMLNQNIGFNRTVTSNYISQNTYSTIKRYFLLSVVWNFNKAGTKAPNQDN